ncbi:MAG: hypothetical protein GX661_01510 [Acholeplasmataceae bacterium]|nr:hypothetical protein [Acholeplasmataceae bacterium]
MFYNKKYYCPVCDRKHHKYNPLPDFYEKNSKAFGFIQYPVQRGFIVFSGSQLSEQCGIFR